MKSFSTAGQAPPGKKNHDVSDADEDDDVYGDVDVEMDVDN